MTWEGLNPPYATIVADPPWDYSDGFPPHMQGATRAASRGALAYSMMTVADISALAVPELVAADAHLYLWTTNRYLEASFEVVRSWGFRPSQVLAWCKSPRGIGPGGAYATNIEFVVAARRGTLSTIKRHPTSWWSWPRCGHSRKPAGFADVVEQVSPGPYCELFAREPRLGWDHWGYGYEGVA